MRSGVLVEKFCAAGACANVEAVFGRSFYLRSGDAFVCVGAPAIGNGPLNLIADIGVPDFQLRPGQPALICDRHITIGNTLRVTLDRSEPWSPPAWPTCLVRPIETCAALKRRAASDAPPEGLAHVVFGASEARHSPMMRIARTHIARFEDGLANRLVSGYAREADLSKAVRGLIGLGPGLTPSGDDFLVGVLALLDAIGERAAHAELAGTVTDALHLTAPLSACFLEAAAAGHIGEHLHLAVSSVMTGDVDVASAAIGNIGHSSGWDMMAGIGVALRLAAAARG
jgi:hypothetical protein